MSDDLSIQGTLAETTVPDLCRSLIRSGETAIISLEAVDRHDSLYFTDGRIVYATTSDPDLELGEILLRMGEINLQQYNDASERMVSSKRIGAVLLELGYLKPEELMRAVEGQVCSIVMHALSFRSGSYTIEFASEFSREILTLGINTERLLMDGVGRVEHWSLIARGIGKMTRLLRQAEDADARIFHLDLSEEESYVYSLFSEPQSIETLCERSYLSNFVTCRTVWGFLSVNLLRETESAQVDERRAALESEFELESSVERYNSAFQKIFNMVFQEIGDHTYDFVDRVVTHISPEVLPYLSGMSLVNEARIDFDQLLNNMIASGSNDKPTIVHNVLNELLYGWIYETKVEFGTRLEERINEIVAGLKG